MLWSCHLGEDYPDHQGLDHDSHDALQAHGEDSFWTLLGGKPEAVTDGVLRFDAEQEAGSE